MTITLSQSLQGPNLSIIVRLSFKEDSKLDVQSIDRKQCYDFQKKPHWVENISKIGFKTLQKEDGVSFQINAALLLLK